jgi:2-C-methyl-D-erythritol 4-phosphate cytidylyltransferase
MRATAIIVGAGSGKRLGAGKPKAFVEVGGLPLLIHSLRALLEANGITSAVLVVPPGSQTACEEMVGRHGPWRCPISVVGGGRERQDSVRAGLSLAGDSDLVAVHDAARPFVSPTVVEHTLELAARHGTAIVAVPARDTVKLVHPDGWIEATPPRQSLWLAQTPQIFRTEILRHAHEHARRNGLVASDDAALVENIGVRVYVVAGNEENRKITTPEDLRWAEWFLSVKHP